MGVQYSSGRHLRVLAARVGAPPLCKRSKRERGKFFSGRLL